MLKIRGCRTNNLKSIDVDIPLNEITCVTGPSGCGKSSLVFHTIANESKRRFLNSTSSESTFFERVPQSADVDLISPVLPVWVLPQHNPIVGSRLNLADQFELTVSLAQLYFEKVQERCPIHLEKYTNSNLDLVDKCKALASSQSDIIHFFIGKSIYTENFQGTAPRVFDVGSAKILDFVQECENWEILRIKISKISELEKKLKEFEFFKRSDVVLIIVSKESRDFEYFKIANSAVCSKCTKLEQVQIKSIDELMPFNGVGACKTCKGYGATLDYSLNKLVKYPTKKFKDGAVSILASGQFQSYEKYYFAELKKNQISLDSTFEENFEIASEILMKGGGKFPGLDEMIGWLEEKRYKRTVRIFLRSIQTENRCLECDSLRISKRAQGVLLSKDFPSMGEVLGSTIDECFLKFQKLKNADNNFKIDKFMGKLSLAIEFGLGSLKLTTKLKELDSSEYQKSLLLRYLSYSGSDSLFVLDEPSLGLSLSEQEVLMRYLKILSQSNTVLIVDHSEYMQKHSGYIIELGPGAGNLGGEIVYTGKYKKSKVIEFEKLKQENSLDFLKLKNTEYLNYKISEIKIPLNQISVVKSFRDSFSKNIFQDVILNELSLKIKGEKIDFDANYLVKKIENFNSLKNILSFENKHDKTSSRSSVGTVLGLSPYLRKYYSNLPVSKALDLKEGHFSSNSELGRCNTCEGRGILEIDMQFLEDIVLKCEECDGKKISRFYSNISDGNFTIYEALNTPITEVFKNIRVPAKAQRILEYLDILNLGYLSPDRSIPSLSGGERLRVKFLNTLQSDVRDSLLYFSNISYGLSVIELLRVRSLLLGLLKNNNTIVLCDSHPIFQDFNVINIKNS